MKRIFTLLTFVFLANTLIYGQCPDIATPNPSNKTFNLSFLSEADRDAAWSELVSITFPAGDGCMCGETIMVDTASLVIDGPVGADNVYRIRAITTTDDYFDGTNGDFMGTITFNKSDNTSEDCIYGTTDVIDGDLNDIVELFPNPVKDRLTLINGKGKVTIFNALGQAIKQMTIDSDQATIQLEELFIGQYYFRILQENGTIVTKQFSKMD